MDIKKSPTIFMWIIIAALPFLAGASKGVCDTINFHYTSSKLEKLNPQYWQIDKPGESWRNKYKNRDDKQGERFPGSSTVFVFVTDAWHLFQQINLVCWQALIILLALNRYHLQNRHWWLVFILTYLAHSAGFHLLYTVIL